MKITLLVGPPGCGKNTWVQNEIKKNPGHAVVLNRDDLRGMLVGGNLWNYKFNKAQEELITTVQFSSAQDAIQLNKNVYVADTNLNPATREAWKQFAKKNKLQYSEVDFFLMFRNENEVLEAERGVQGVIAKFRARCKEWNLKRLHSVPEFVIDKMIDDYIVPQYVNVKQYHGTPGKPKAIIVDLDGTLFHMQDMRGPFEWDKVHLDAVDEHVRETIHLYKNAGYVIIAASGRDGICKNASQEAMTNNLVPWDHFFIRAIQDQRPDWIVKEEIFWRDIAPYWDVRLAIDDRDQVVNHYRAMNLKVYQVAPGNF